MDRTLYEQVTTALLAADLPDDAKACVVAACQGDEAVDALLADEQLEVTPPPPTTAPAAETWLTHIEVQGFRGVGPAARLDLDPVPGLTLVLGRNGSGKSSLAEGLEVVLGGLDDSRRWAGRANQDEWRQGWSNLAWDGSIHVEAGVCRSDGTTFVARRAWVDREDATPTTQAIDAGWADAIVYADPVLTYAELGQLPEAKATDRYKQLSHLLGLDALTAATSRLAKRRTEVERLGRELKAAAKDLLGRLDELDDERAERARDALKQHTWAQRTAALDALMVEDAGQADETRLKALKALLSIRRPASPDTVIEQLDDALARREALAGTAQAEQQRLADLLKKALEFPEGDCPVCLTPAVLDPAWRAQAQERVASAQLASTQASDVGNAVTAAERAGRQLCTRPPAALTAHGTESARDAWATWATGSALGDTLLRQHLATTWSPLDTALQTCLDAAQAELDDLDELWRPLQQDLTALLTSARTYATKGERAKPFKKAETWLAALEGQLREDRLAPISARSCAIWEALRQDSSVSLEDLVLGGRRNNPTIDVSVQVDGQTTSALAVMSQGELNALALALFLPRATQDDSPFRFVLIDDPVQAMDPHKVDGLATLLHELAQDRQVVVFSHDFRLGEALGRLGYPARYVSVRRADGAQVHVDPSGRPLDVYWREVELAMSERGRVGEEVVAQVVPGLLRMAVEAHFTDVVRRRELPRQPHTQVSRMLAECRRTTQLVALAVFEDPGAEDRLDQWVPHGCQGVLQALNRGAHGAGDRKARQLVKHTRMVLDAELP